VKTTHLFEDQLEIDLFLLIWKTIKYLFLPNLIPRLDIPLNLLYLAKLSSPFKHVILSIDVAVEPTTYEITSKHHNWRNTMDMKNSRPLKRTTLGMLLLYLKKRLS